MRHDQTTLIKHKFCKENIGTKGDKSVLSELRALGVTQELKSVNMRDKKVRKRVENRSAMCVTFPHKLAVTERVYDWQNK